MARLTTGAAGAARAVAAGACARPDIGAADPAVTRPPLAPRTAGATKRVRWM